MAIIASFTAVPSGGLIPPSVSVQFTDTSQGSPDSWLWTFGDGGISNEQHPEHTFTGNAGDSFTVTLKAWITSSAPSIFMGLTGDKYNAAGSPLHGDNDTAWSDFIDEPFVWNPLQPSGKTGFYLNNSNGGIHYAYGAAKETRIWSVPGTPGGGGPSTYVIEAKLNSLVIYPSSHTIISDIGGSISAGLTQEVWHPFLDIDDLVGTSPTAIFETAFGSFSKLPDPADNSYSGIIADFRVIDYRTSSADNYDTIEGSIMFGIPPIADFTGDPTAGPDPLSVQFENLTTEAIGTPTTYIWKKRIAGSGDPFVQFSTSKNPLEIFTKQ